MTFRAKGLDQLGYLLDCLADFCVDIEEVYVSVEDKEIFEKINLDRVNEMKVHLVGRDEPVGEHVIIFSEKNEPVILVKNTNFRVERLKGTFGNLDVEINGPGRCGHIRLDDKGISGVRKMVIDCRYDSIPSVYLEMLLYHDKVGKKGSEG